MTIDEDRRAELIEWLVMLRQRIGWPSLTEIQMALKREQDMRVAKATVQHWFQRKSVPRPGTFEAVARVLGASEEEIAEQLGRDYRPFDYHVSDQSPVVLILEELKALREEVGELREMLSQCRKEDQ